MDEEKRPYELETTLEKVAREGRAVAIAAATALLASEWIAGALSVRIGVEVDPRWVMGALTTVGAVAWRGWRDWRRHRRDGK